MTRTGNRWLWPAVAGLFSLIAGEFSTWTLLQHLGLALCGVVLVSWIIAVGSIATLRVQGISLAPTVTAGDYLTIRYMLRNRGPWPLAWILLEPHGFAALPVQPQYVAVGPRRGRAFDVALACLQRGYWVAGGWTIRTGDPFGLFERTRTRSGEQRVIVYPKPLPLPGLHITAHNGRTNSRRGAPTQQASAAIREVRPYQPGDPPSRIHWLSSARLDRLVVKEPEGEPALHAWVILDLEQQVQYGTEAGDSVELVVSAACTVLQRLLHVHIASGLLVAGSSMTIQPDDRAATQERLLHALAGVRAGTEHTDHIVRHIQRGAGHHAGDGRGMLVLITPWADERWVGLLKQWQRSGHDVLCVLIDAPDSGRGEELETQSARLRASGVRVYRRTAWAA